MEDKITISLRLKSDLLEKIKKAAREKSLKEQKDTNYLDMIRLSLLKDYGEKNK